MTRSSGVLVGLSVVVLVVIGGWWWKQTATALVSDTTEAATSVPAQVAKSTAPVTPTLTSKLPATVSLRVTGEPLMSGLERLAKQLRVGLIIHHDAQDAVREDVEIDLVERSWDDLLTVMWLHRVLLTLDGDVLMIRNWENGNELRMERVFYSTATMTKQPTPQPGPRLGIQDLLETTVAQPLFGNVHESDGDDPSRFIEEVQSGVAPESWSNLGVFIEDYNGAMIVGQSPEAHAELVRFIATRERRLARQVVVRCHRLTKPPVGPGLILDAATWTKVAKDLPVADAAFTVIDGQCNHHFSGVRRSYIATDLVQNGLGSPVMGMSTSGLVIEVEPHITVEGISTRIRLQATVSDAMTTSPVKDAAGRLLFDMDLPDQRIDQADDVRLIPPGGAALYRFDDRTYAVSVEALIP